LQADAAAEAAAAPEDVYSEMNNSKDRPAQSGPAHTIARGLGAMVAVRGRDEGVATARACDANGSRRTAQTAVGGADSSAAAASATEEEGL